MAESVLASLILCKQRHRKRLNEKKCKRRSLLNLRRVFIDATLTNLPVTPSSIQDKTIEENLRSSDIDKKISVHLCEANNDDYLLHNLHGVNDEDVCGDLFYVNDDDNVHVDLLDTNDDNYKDDDSRDINVANELNDNLTDHFTFTLSLVQTDTLLHDLTGIKKNDYCKNLLLFLRDAKICKSHSIRLIQLIQSALPIPNNMPRSLKDLVAQIHVEQLFLKREICSICDHDVDRHDNGIECISTGKRNNANVFDIDVKIAFNYLINRLWPSIVQYKKQIKANLSNEYNDIPFNAVYRTMISGIENDTNFISLILHLDGISICKSTKLKLWLLSGIFIELPPHLRYRRCNMILISVYMGYEEPQSKLWLSSSFSQLNQLKKDGVILMDGAKCEVLFYGVIGDCPALKLILEFNGHTGYYCCFYCYIEGVHVGGRGGKRQYRFQDGIRLREEHSYELESMKAAKTSTKVYGHLDRSILHDLLDVPLPYSIIADYLHVTLLRHTRAIVQQIYSRLSPSQRIKLDSNLRTQNFPHFFNRKVRAVSDFAFIKGTELKNLLLYALIPHLLTFLPEERLAHVALFVCFIRIIHGKKSLGPNTNLIAKELFLKYYQDHELHFKELQNFVLHVHVHFDQLFNHHGSLCYLGTFSQEDFIGSISKNHHGTRFHGELITYYYEIDFALRNIIPSNNSSLGHIIEGPFDQAQVTLSNIHDLTQHHLDACGCNKPDQCVLVFRRCMIDKRMYHSLIYSRRNSTISYFVQYRQNQKGISFGKIKLFFTSNNDAYALIEHYKIKTRFSEYFMSSSYYDLLFKSIDLFYFVLYSHASSINCVPISSIENHCVVFEMVDHIIVTPLSICYEHD